ncbi:MAG: HAMP domain-containing histidine kinase [Candidatus Cloacimonetes bacterium]|nr:HAMP domain-containing histidine kinase [Candidatus Cloacimonadota bacterium]
MEKFLTIYTIEQFKKRIKWFIILRFIAIIGVFVVLLATKNLLNIKLPFFQLYLGNMLLLILNTFHLLYNQKLNYLKVKEVYFKKANIFVNIQISLDLVLLTYFVHFAGGVENPFTFYYIFHIVIASILLSNKAAYYQAIFSAFLFGSIILTEYLHILPHYSLIGFSTESLNFHTFGYIVGIFSVFVSTLFIVVYMTTSIVNKLWEREIALCEANERLREKDRLKSQYVLIVSHDLQASLSAIQSCLKVVLSNFTGSISERSREMITRAEQRSLSLLHFVKDLLDLSKMRALDETKKEKILFWKIVKKVAEKFNVIAEEKKLNLSLGNNSKDFVIGNPQTLEEMMDNLVINAIKYTPRGGKISIDHQLSLDPEFIKVSVSDTGIGIRQNNLPFIFDDFFRAKNALMLDKNGTGLGLSIVKQIVESHNGEIWVESKLGEGSKFTFTLPKANIIGSK